VFSMLDVLERVRHYTLCLPRQSIIIAIYFKGGIKWI
jgi:hypothetical protein